MFKDLRFKRKFAKACRSVELDPDEVILEFMGQFIYQLDDADSAINNWVWDTFTEVRENITRKSSRQHLKVLFNKLEPSLRDIIEAAAGAALGVQAYEVTIDRVSLTLLRNMPDLFDLGPFEHKKLGNELVKSIESEKTGKEVPSLCPDLVDFVQELHSEFVIEKNQEFVELKQFVDRLVGSIYVQRFV